MEISNPRRILAVSLADADSTRQLCRVIEGFGGSAPEPAPASGSLAGTTHLLPLTTAYYTAQVPVWLDLVTSPAEWAASFLAPEAREVLAVLGGVVIVFALPDPATTTTTTTTTTTASGPGAEVGDARELIAQVGRVVREGLGGWDWDGVGLAVGVGDVAAGEDEDAVLGEWEDACAACGLEFVHAPLAAASASVAADSTATGDVHGERRNEFGEKMGIARALEALQANDWSAAGGDSGDGEEDEDEEFGGFAAGNDDGASNRRRMQKGIAGEDEVAEESGSGGNALDPESLNFGFDRADFVGLRKAIRSAGREDDGEDDFFLVNDRDEGTTAEAKAEAKAEAEAEAEAKMEAGPTGPPDDADGDEAFGDEDVQTLERMMRKLQAVRDLSAGLPEERRRRLARQAVAEVMKEL